MPELAVLVFLGLVPALLLLIRAVIAATRALDTHAHDGESPTDEEAIWGPIGGSTLELDGLSAELKLIADTPVFRTLRLSHEDISPGKWKLKIRFLLFNSSLTSITVDDLHTRIYERQASSPPLLTIGYRRELFLLQDNSIWKQDESYHLASGDGYDMTVVLEVTRMEGSPVYGSFGEMSGAFRAVFGFFVDYYTISPIDELRRYSIPSDCLYVFECAERSGTPHFQTLSHEFIEELKVRFSQDVTRLTAISQLEKHVAEHMSRRPTPTVK